MIEEFMTAGEAQAYLGVSKQRLQELGNTGKIERQRMGRFWLYKRLSVESYRNTPKDRGGRPKASAGTLNLASPARANLQR